MKRRDHRRILQRPARPRRRRHHRTPFVHLLLARGRDRLERSRVDRVLRRRHRRASGGKGCALVHPRRHAVLVRGARRVHRKLRDVRSRRRVPGRQGSDGRHACEAVGLGAALRLRPDGADQWRLGGPIHRRAAERLAASVRQHAQPAGRRDSGVCRGAHHRLFLVAQHPGHSRVERGCDADHGGDHRDGGPHDRLVRTDAAVAGWGTVAAGADPEQSALLRRCAWVAARDDLAQIHRDCDPRRLRSLHSRDERRGIAGAGLSRNRASEGEEPAADGPGDLRLQLAVHLPGQLLRDGHYSRQRPTEVLRQLDFRSCHERRRAALASAPVSSVRRDRRLPDAGWRGEHGRRRIERRPQPRIGRWGADGMVPETARQVRNDVSAHQPGGPASAADHRVEQGRCIRPR